jgi:hypothetical protein
MEKNSLCTENIIKTKRGKRIINNVEYDCTYYLKFCFGCGKLMKTHMVNKLTDSSNCRQKLSRLIEKGANPVFNKNNITYTKTELKLLGFTEKEK